MAETQRRVDRHQSERSACSDAAADGIASSARDVAILADGMDAIARDRSGRTRISVSRHRVLLSAVTTEPVGALSTGVRAIDAVSSRAAEAWNRRATHGTRPDRREFRVGMPGFDHSTLGGIAEAELDDVRRFSAVDVERALARWGRWDEHAESESFHVVIMRTGVLHS